MTYLDAQGHKTVSDAVAQAELSTSGEIVTVLADRSDGYTDVILLWAVAASFTAMSAFALWPELLHDLLAWANDGWASALTVPAAITLALGLGVAVFLLAWLILSWDRLTFATIPGPVKTARVHDRAVRHFKVGAERRTHGRTGVLIYLSMKEHRAEIVADRPIAEKVPAEVWGEAMVDMLVEIKQGRVAEGMAAGVRDVGRVLAGHFPRDEGDTNELPDRLIEI